MFHSVIHYTTGASSSLMFEVSVSKWDYSIALLPGVKVSENIFSPSRQELPFLELSEVFLSRPVISAKALKAV